MLFTNINISYPSELFLSTAAIICFASFVLGGVVKGTLGVGLPLLAIPLMSVVIPSPRAIGLVAIPVISSNVWQMIESRQLVGGLRRFWPLIITQVFITLLTVRITLSLNAGQMNKLIAVSMILAVVLMAFKPNFRVSPSQEKKISAFVGVLSGILGGVSALTGPVVITYLFALKLSRSEFVGCISIIYLASSLPLYAAMIYYQRMGVQDLGYSVLALVPMAIGLIIGKLIRDKMSEKVFRSVLYSYLIAMSVALILR